MANASSSTTRQPQRWRTAVVMGLLAVAVLLVYFPRKSASGTRALLGMDYQQLHMRRIVFAQQALLGPEHHLPAWYPREFLGMPFWSYTPSFPIIPTRIILLGFCSPLHLYTVAVSVGAVLAAWFTFLYCRTIGLGLVGSAAAGWTFACAGFFAARVTAGHLAILEAYAALPLLLWLGEILIQRFEHGRAFALPLMALSISVASTALAGHPQIPLYAMIVTALYVLVRSNWRATCTIAAAATLGIGMAAFALWPMTLLVARSTRMLALRPAHNDIAMPFSRLMGFFLPWFDGVPSVLANAADFRQFAGYFGDAYFWDTFCYLGWLPWIAILILVAVRGGRERMSQRAWLFWLVVGFAALLLALPWSHGALRFLSGSFIRSPVRLLYITTFALALLLGLCVDEVLRGRARSIVTIALVTVALGIHAFDLGSHSRTFVRSTGPPPSLAPATIAQLKSELGDGRIGIDQTMYLADNRRFDDVGFYDSMALGRTYEAIVALCGAQPEVAYEESINGGGLSARALEATATRLLITGTFRLEFQALYSASGIRIYRIGDRAARRVEFFPESRIVWLDPGATLGNLRDPSFDVDATLMLPLQAKRRSAESAPPNGTMPASVVYERISSDEIAVQAAVSEPGYLRIIEAFDLGWRATIDDRPVEILPANHAFMAVHLQPGRHLVRLTYHTVGVRTGWIISLLSVTGVIVLGVLCSVRLQRTR